MPRVSGIFDYFDNLEEISVDDLVVNLKVRPDLKNLENYIANRIIYPQAASLTKDELELDLAILKQGLSKNPAYYNKKEKRIIIPEVFYERFPNLLDLCMGFIDTYQPKELVTLVLSKQTGDENLGTYLWADFINQDSLTLNIEETPFKINPGLNVLPCNKGKCHIIFNSKQGQLLGKNELVFEVYGGSLGLIIDGRQK